MSRVGVGSTFSPRRQHGVARASGLPVDMRFAMVFTLSDGLETHMAMYADPAEALKAVGLA